MMIKNIYGLMLTLVSALVEGSSQSQEGQITVTISNMRSAQGVVRACMTDQRDIFPRCRRDPKSYRAILPAAGNLSFTFEEVRPGNYAIALLHDENGDGKANRVFGMMPTEGFGFSRDAKVMTGPPKFEDAAFDFDGTEAQFNIRMRYML